MNFDNEAARVAAVCQRKTEPRAVVIMGVESVRTCPVSRLHDTFLRRPGFVGVYDGRVSERDLHEDLQWVFERMSFQ